MGARDGERSLYDILDVGAGASFDEIEASYERIVTYLDSSSLAIYSMMDDEEAAQVRAQVDEAYRTLSDPERRRAYDRAAGWADADYPPVVVPQSHSDSSLSFGSLGAGPREPLLGEAGAGGSAAPPRSRPAPERAVAGTSSVAVHHERPAPAAVPRRSRPRRLHPSPDIEVHADTEMSGALLRRLRESAGATLEEVAEITKISRRYLIAVEENDFEALPAAVYVRGFVCEYARVLGLSPDLVGKSYMAFFRRYTDGKA